MYNIGSIVIIKNLEFKTGTNCFDHAYKGGRPCLVVAMDDDRFYFVPLKSNVKNKFPTEIIINKKYCLKNSVVNIEWIYEREAYYYKEAQRIGNQELVKILSYLYDYHIEHNQDENFHKIKDFIEDKIKVLKK